MPDPLEPEDELEDTEDENEDDLPTQVVPMGWPGACALITFFVCVTYLLNSCFN